MVNTTTTNTKSQSNTGLITRAVSKVIYFFRLTIFVLFRFAYYFLYKYGILAIPPPPETVTTLSTDYISLQKSKFLASYENLASDSYNTNIEKCFYDSKLHALAVEDANNELEKKWKRRIMFENTPRGNVIMYYDAFKQGFVYYSDHSHMPYFLINAVVMKYVLLYRCRDFFLDDQITPENKHSPLLNISSKSEPSTETTTNDESITKTSEKPPALKSSAFAKLKNYNTVSGKLISLNSQTDKNESDKPDERKYTRNKIIYYGKISNFNFLQKTKVVKHVAFSSDLLDGLKSNNEVQRQDFSYKDFKKLKDKQITNFDETK